MSGELPLLSLRMSDVKLRNVLELVDSIPLPESRPAARGPSSTSKARSHGSVHILSFSNKLVKGKNKKKWILFLSPHH